LSSADFSEVMGFLGEFMPAFSAHQSQLTSVARKAAP
jgi:hypothetical protein